jgi:hypothetical protein
MGQGPIPRRLRARPSAPVTTPRAGRHLDAEVAHVPGRASDPGHRNPVQQRLDRGDHEGPRYDPVAAIGAAMEIGSMEGKGLAGSSPHATTLRTHSIPMSGFRGRGRLNAVLPIPIPPGARAPQGGPFPLI